MCHEYLSEDEWKYCEKLLSQLSSIDWIQRLTTKIQNNGGATKDNKDFFFELRFAAELVRLNINAQYEFKALPPTSVDFKLSNGHEWLIELCRIGVSKAVKAATSGDQRLWETRLHTTQQLFSMQETETDEMKQSEEGEILLVQQKILGKVFSDGKPIKFPPVTGNRYHLLLIDMRSFLLGLGDKYDYDFIALGKEGVPHEVYLRYWNGKPIKGLLDPENLQRGAGTLQERIHFIGFVNEKEYGSGQFQRQIYYVCNHFLFKNADEARRIYNAIPYITAPD